MKYILKNSSKPTENQPNGSILSENYLDASDLQIIKSPPKDLAKISDSNEELWDNEISEGVKEPIKSYFDGKGHYLAYFGFNKADASKFDEFVMSQEILIGIKSFLVQHNITKYNQIHVEMDLVDLADIPVEQEAIKGELVFYRLYIYIETSDPNDQLAEITKKLVLFIPALFNVFLSDKGIEPPTFIMMHHDSAIYSHCEFPEIELVYEKADFNQDLTLFKQTLSPDQPHKCYDDGEFFKIGFLTPLSALKIIASSDKSPEILNFFNKIPYSDEEWNDILLQNFIDNSIKFTIDAEDPLKSPSDADEGIWHPRIVSL